MQLHAKRCDKINNIVNICRKCLKVSIKRSTIYPILNIYIVVHAICTYILCDGFQYNIEFLRSKALQIKNDIFFYLILTSALK